jgi:hypothetical protein
LDPARLAACRAALAIEALKQDPMHMARQSYGAPEALAKGHRPRLDLLPFDVRLDRLMDVILRDRGADDRMGLGGQCF